MFTDFGYGGKHRDTNHILSFLIDKFNLIEIGFPSKTPQVSTVKITDDHQKSLLFECSLMKYCDVFLGAEGGLCNMACGVGCRTITTGDFVLQLYGWNGAIKKIKEPKLGTIYYFKDKGHVVLDPYLTDEEVAKGNYKEYMNNLFILGYNAVDYFCEWYKHEDNPNTKMRFIDNGQQKIPIT